MMPALAERAPVDVDAPRGAVSAPAPPERRPELVGWVCVALILLFLGLVRINPVDVPWHLATARLARATGHWPTRNAFSWTYPEYVLYQQYPVFQAAIYVVQQLGGWRALSVLTCLGWMTVFALHVRAAGPFARAVPFQLFWALVAFTLQTRTMLRPELLTLSFIPLQILLLDAYRRRRAWIAGLPALHLVWVNAHQLFVLSFAVQGIFLGHLLLARWGRFGVDDSDRALPLWPPLLALVASVAASFASPIGADVVGVFAHTSGSLAHRAEVQELARVWSDPVWLVLALVVTVPAAVVLARSWRRWNPFELGLWVLAVALGVSGIRGLVFATLMSGVILQRTLLRLPITWRPSLVLRRFFRALAVVGSAVLAFAVLYHRWLAPATALGGAQAGWGQSDGDWPSAAIATLAPDPPPGPMMNLPWTLANDIIWDWPARPVFVDPRFESYPREFLIDALASRGDDAVLDRLIATFQPGWVFADHCLGPERARIAHLLEGGDWVVTYADVQTVVLVNRTDQSADYRARHAFTPARLPAGLSGESPARRARQRLCYARLLGMLGFSRPAREQLTEADLLAGADRELRAEIAEARQTLAR
jgi:hypothetical protein